ncbi:hypothetical protein ACLUWI_09935, partial [Limosilactobacillus mucosae]|uniref:hypothetical protein n=1 Tax=Limosilactobacillus mucosae TaxID=97478 RepID=UPI0039965A61
KRRRSIPFRTEPIVFLSVFIKLPGHCCLPYQEHQAASSSKVTVKVGTSLLDIKTLVATVIQKFLHNSPCENSLPAFLKKQRIVGKYQCV